jgi:hypothetical protein
MSDAEGNNLVAAAHPTQLYVEANDPDVVPESSLCRASGIAVKQHASQQRIVAILLFKQGNFFVADNLWLIRRSMPRSKNGSGKTLPHRLPAEW